MNAVNTYDVIYIAIAAIAVNLLWKLACYELTLHFGYRYVVTVKYYIYSSEFQDTYMVTAFSEESAYKKAFEKFCSSRNYKDIKKITITKAD